MGSNPVNSSRKRTFLKGVCYRDLEKTKKININTPLGELRKEQFEKAALFCCLMLYYNSFEKVKRLK